MTSRRFSDQIRAAVKASELSRYRIAKEIGIGEATMSRFLTNKGGLSMASLDKLAELIGLEVVARSRDANTGG